MKMRPWFIVLFLIITPALYAQAIDIPGLEETAGAANIDRSFTSPEVAVTVIIQWVLSLVGVLFLILMIWGGFSWMTSGGNQEQIKKARRTVTSAAIGLIIVLSAYALTVYIGGILSATSPS